MDAAVKPLVTLPAVAAADSHFDGQRYFQPGIRTLRKPGEVLRWIASSDRRHWPDRRPNRHYPALPPALNDHQIGVTMIGHATLMIQAGGLRCLTDPVFSACAGPAGRLGPRRTRAPGLTLAQLPPIDLVLLSHDHYDHLDLPSLQWLERHHGVTVICGLGHRSLLQRAGLQKVVELDWWQGVQVDGDSTVHFVPAQHWCGRSLHDRNLRLWGGLFLRTPAGSVYFAGDTGYGPHFADIRRHLGPPDLALLPIGAYAPRWFMAVNHMSPADAVAAHGDLDARPSRSTTASSALVRKASTNRWKNCNGRASKRDCRPTPSCGWMWASPAFSRPPPVGRCVMRFTQALERMPPLLHFLFQWPISHRSMPRLAASRPWQSGFALGKRQ